MHYHLGVFRMLLLGFVMSLTTESSGLKVGAHSKELVKSFESRLLGVLGLRSRPRPRKPPRIPDYMVALYRAREMPGKAQPQEKRALALHHDNLQYLTSNTARSFDPEVTGPLKMLDDPSELLLRFDVSTIPTEELSRAAELRVFRGRTRRSNCGRQSSTHRIVSGEEGSSPNITRREISRLVKKGIHFQVYDVVNANLSGFSDEPFLRLLDTREVDLQHAGWETLDVFPALERWRRNPPDGNQGLLLLRLVSADGYRPSAACAVRVGRPDSALDKRPILVAYTDDNRGGSAETSRRTKRNARKHRRKGRKNNCRRLTLYVDFNDVGWNDWIVAPPGYHAFHCNGECPFPLADHLNSTNHAIVQTLVNSVNPKAVPRACCVPTELSPISLLYVDEYDKVVLKNYPDMVVEGCGCR